MQWIKRSRRRISDSSSIKANAVALGRASSSRNPSTMRSHLITSHISLHHSIIPSPLHRIFHYLITSFLLHYLITPLHAYFIALGFTDIAYYSHRNRCQSLSLQQKRMVIFVNTYNLLDSKNGNVKWKTYSNKKLF